MESERCNLSDLLFCVCSLVGARWWIINRLCGQRIRDYVVGARRHGQIREDGLWTLKRSTRGAKVNPGKPLSDLSILSSKGLDMSTGEQRLKTHTLSEV